MPKRNFLGAINRYLPLLTATLACFPAGRVRETRRAFERFNRVQACIAVHWVHAAFRFIMRHTLDRWNRKDLAPERIRLACFSIFKEREPSFYHWSFIQVH